MKEKNPLSFVFQLKLMLSVTFAFTETDLWKTQLKSLSQNKSMQMFISFEDCLKFRNLT